MEIEAEDVTDGIAKVVLRGRFDTTRAVEVELPFNRIVTEQRKVLVDLAAVSFLTSYAIRVLLAKIVKKNGKLVILCPDGKVAKVLKTAGVDGLIPVYVAESAAIEPLRL